MKGPLNLIRSLLAVAFVSHCTFAFAQPNPYGCHYFRHGNAPHPTPTDAQRTQIDETIARSDTFDILHYDITLDVTQVWALTITAATEITFKACLLYTSDAADERSSVDLGGRRIIKKKKYTNLVRCDQNTNEH